MVNQAFIDKLNANISNEVRDLMAGPAYITAKGTGADQYKGLGDELATALIPFKKSTYQAQEYVFVRIPIKDQNVGFVDFVAPVLNVKGKSVQGVGTFATYTPNPVAETYVERMIGFGYKLVPHSMVVEQGMKPKEVLKGNMIKSQAINEINADKKLCNLLHGHSDCRVAEGIIGSAYFKLEVPWLDYPPGMLTVIPYKGHTFLVSKDAGGSGAMADSPKYPFKERVAAFIQIAAYLAKHREGGEAVGKFYMDNSMEMIVPQLMDYLKQPAAAAPQ